jgi:hypothetical protein
MQDCTPETVSASPEPEASSAAASRLIPHQPAYPPPVHLVRAAAAKTAKQAEILSLIAEDLAWVAAKAAAAAMSATDRAMVASDALNAKKKLAAEQTAVADQLAVANWLETARLPMRVPNTSVYPTDDGHLEEPEDETGGASSFGSDGSDVKRPRRGQS